MKKLGLFLACAALFPVAAHAHRLDEYLQATLLSLDAGGVEASVRLVPGVAVAPQIIRDIDLNGDGILSAAEQQAYAQNVLSDLVLKVDGRAEPLQVESFDFPALDQVKQGLGEIHLRLRSNVTFTAGSHQLSFENHHQSSISVYLVNCLAPEGNNFQITNQARDTRQTTYRLGFAVGATSDQTHIGSLSGFDGAFRMGLQHIAEGTDHLLFLLALLLPAPLLACSGRWNKTASVHQSLAQILRIVTAFTLGHSLTLALAAFGIVQVPARPVEILIAVSILVSAVHALRPLFPGRESALAAGFGLVHGLAFASALSSFGYTGWYRAISLLGFNLGIECMQLAVVVAVLPSLLLLSRTSLYSTFRVAGVLCAALASTAWIIERGFNTRNPVEPAVEGIAHHGVGVAIALAVFSFSAWAFQKARSTVHFTAAAR